MRNLRIVRKFSSEDNLPSPDTSVFCVGEHGYLFQVTTVKEVNGQRNEGVLPSLNRVSQSLYEELCTSALLHGVIHMHFISNTGSLYLGTQDGHFLQYCLHSGELEELFQAETGMIMFQVSPDSRFVTILTANGTLILLTLTTLEVVCENQLFNRCENGTLADSMGICWRHDSQYFAVNIPMEASCRKIMVYDEHGGLFSSTDEATSPIDSNILAWMPSGALVSAIERAPVGKEGVLISFFELNGLKRSSFPPKQVSGQVGDSTIKSLLWNLSSEILAIVRKGTVELWHRSNYLWMCKYTVFPSLDSNNTDEIKFVGWDSENAYRLYVILRSGCYSIYDFVFAYSSGNSMESALSVVINGSDLYCTPFKFTSAPPPYGYFQVSVEFNVQEVVFSSFWDGFLCVLVNSNIVQIKNSENYLTTSRVITIPFNEEVSSNAYNWAWPNSHTICAVSGKYLLVYQVPNTSSADPNYSKTSLNLKHRIPFAEIFISVVPTCSESSIAIFRHDDHISLFNIMDVDDSPKLLFKTHANFNDLKYILTGALEKRNENLADYLLIICHDVFTRRLRIFLKSRDYNLAMDCTSTAVFNDYLLYTTVQGTLEIIHASQLEKALNGSQVGVEHYSRKVEKGSLIVSCCWNRLVEPTVVLQVLPRGNIETIHPRPLVIASMRALLRDPEKRSFNVIMGAMRRHRIDANILVDELKLVEADKIYNLTMKDALTNMTNEVQDSNLLVLFVTEISSTNLDCVQLLRNVLQTRTEGPTLKSAIQPYLATMAKLGLYEEVLNSSLILGEADREVVKKRVKFLSFYTDKAETLYEAALGTYDLNLTAVVADCLNKDPKEYLPILNNLRTLPHLKKRFSINTTLKKWALGLQDLLEDPSAEVQEISKYAQKHQLYPEAIKLLLTNSVLEKRDIHDITSIRKSIQGLYGEFLESRGKNREASILYRRGGNMRKAFDCAVKAGCWEYALVVDENPETSKSWQDILQYFRQKQEWSNAARLCEVYLNDYRLAVEYWTMAHQWAHAFALTVKDASLQILQKEMIIPQLRNYQLTLTEFLKTLHEEFRHHLTRFKVIKAKKNDVGDVGDLDNFSDTESISTTSSMKSSTSNQSGRTYRSGRSKRKQERKIYSLKEGSRHEDKAIIARVWESATNVQLETKPDVALTLEYLWRVELDSEAINLSKMFDELVEEIDAIVHEIWTNPPTDAPTDEEVVLDPKYRVSPSVWSPSWEKLSLLSCSSLLGESSSGRVIV